MVLNSNLMKGLNALPGTCYTQLNAVDVKNRDANLSSKFLSGQLDNFLALSGQFLVNRLSTK